MTLTLNKKANELHPSKVSKQKKMEMKSRCTADLPHTKTK